jgi:CelD/BcsL family acetyltransferase involved in cellulose biosynthesis
MSTVSANEAAARPREVRPVDPAALTWRIHTSMAEARGAWLALEAEGAARAFQTLAWAQAWLDTCAEAGGEPRIAVASLGREPVILLPLWARRSFGVETIRFLGDPWNDYNAPIVSRAYALPSDQDGVASLLRGLAASCAGSASLVIAKQSPCLADGLPNPMLVPSTEREDGSAYVLDLDPAMASDTWQGRGPFFSSLDRKAKKLRRDGDVRFEVLEGGAEAEAFASIMLEWKRRSLAARGTSNPFANPSGVAFMRRVARAGAPLARVYALRLDERPIAIALGLVEPGSLVLYQTAYDPDFAKVSPGGQLIREMIRSLAREGAATLDFSFGDDAYKRDIGAREIPLTRITVPIGTLGQVSGAIGSMGLAARRLVKRHKPLYAAAVAINRRVAGALPADPPLGPTGADKD